MDQQTQTRNFDQILPEFKAKLSSHGLDITKLDDTQWREVVNEIQPLFDGYTPDAVGGSGSYQR